MTIEQGRRELDMSKKAQVVKPEEIREDTAQTAGLLRQAGVDSETTGAERIWIGMGYAEPHTRSAKHHHGEAETATYVISGRMRVCFGENYEECIEAGPGDFIYVPAHIHHYEENVWDERAVAVVSRSPDNLVYNLE